MHVAAITDDRRPAAPTVTFVPDERRGRLTSAGGQISCGLGDAATAGRAVLHELTVKALGRLRELDATEAVFELPDGVDPALAATAIAEACVFSDYDLGRFKREPGDDDQEKLESVSIAGADAAVVSGEKTSRRPPPGPTSTGVLSMSRVVPTRAATASRASPRYHSGTSESVVGCTSTR